MHKKFLQRFSSLLFIFFFFTQLSQAQNRVVTGTVTDAQGVGIPGVSVSVRGTNRATQTSSTGAYSIEAAGNAVLIFTSVGYGTSEVNVSGNTTVNTSLTTQNSSLNEVVVIGYGTARRRDLTGSVTSVQAKDFNQGLISSPQQLLQNKVPGLEITTNSGQPGASTTVKIRGNSSIRASNNPLYVVDGVPLDGRSARPNSGGAFGNTPGSDPLLYINPYDIAQIDVLKDASSAAIYGSRGANGVIVITTKKGTSGATKLEVGTSFGLNAGYMKKFKVLDAGQFRSALAKYGLPATGANSLDGGSSVDALDAITQNKLSQTYNLSFSGGNETGKFRASFLGSRQQGFLKKSSLDKYIGTFSGQYKFIDNRLTLDFSVIAGNYTENLTSVSNNAGSTGNLLTAALSWNPTQPFYNSTGLYNLNLNGTANPLALSDAYSDVSSVNSFLANVSATFRIAKNLDYKFLYGVNHGAGDRKINVEGFLVGFPGLSGQGQAALVSARLLSQTVTHTLNYRTNLTPHLTLDALGGFEYWKSISTGGGISASGFNTNLNQANRVSIPYTSIFQNATTQNPQFTYADPTVEIQSVFARANLNLLDKYILTGTIRADGSSKFGKNKKYGYFPSVGAKWVVSKESFMDGSNLFSNVALRASYGVTGNQEFPAGSSQEQFSLQSFNNAPQAIVPNPNLKWETTKSVNAGIDFSILKGKIYSSIDYYNKNTSDILFQTVSIQPAPSAIQFINLPSANLINSGVEFAIGASLISRENFGWDANFNIAYNKNRLKNFLDKNTGLPLLIKTGTIDGQGVSGTLSQVLANNQPVNAYYLKTFKGFDQTGNQIISDPGTEAVAGDPNPHVLAGFSTTLRYNKFALSINAGGAYGFLIYNNTATSVTNINGITSGRNIDLEAYKSAEGKSSGVGASTRFLEKGDYAKLRNATLRYGVGNLGRFVKGGSVFISGSNLFVITKFTGFDPEVNIDKASGAYPSRSIEYVPYPTPRTISFGVNFSL